MISAERLLAVASAAAVLAMLSAGGATAQGSFLHPATPPPDQPPAAPEKPKKPVKPAAPATSTAAPAAAPHAKPKARPAAPLPRRAPTSAPPVPAVSVAPPPPKVDPFPAQLWDAVTCKADLGALLHDRPPTNTMTSQFYPGTGYIYKFPTPISHNGWQIVGVYVDPFLFRPATVVHAYVIAPEAEVIALSSTGPALPRKKGELKWQTGKVSLFQYDVPRLMGVPLDIGYRSARTTTLATYDRQIAEITLWDNGISKISCYNPPGASSFYG